MRTRHGHVVTAVLLLIAVASRGERTMFMLYRILLRLAVAWLVIVGAVAAIAAICGAFRGHDWSVAVAVPMMVVGPAFLIGVLAWIIKPVQLQQD
jgi:hypothetical protein